jgi:hypothetical protein
VHNRKEKHKAKEMFIVTAKTDDKVKVQKVLHPLSSGKGKFMSKVYQTDQKRLRTIHRPLSTGIDDDDTNSDEETLPATVSQQKNLTSNWNPVNEKFFSSNEDSDDDGATVQDLITTKKRDKPGHNRLAGSLFDSDNDDDHWGDLVDLIRNAEAAVDSCLQMLLPVM